jgi:hypothetical protein
LAGGFRPIFLNLEAGEADGGSGAEGVGGLLVYDA